MAGNNSSVSERGTALIEFTVVFPILVLMTFGLIDLGFVMFTVAEGNRATQVGVRTAVTIAPIAEGLNATVGGLNGALNGTACFDPITGQDTGACASVPEYTCYVNRSNVGICESSGPAKTFNRASFDLIKNSMASQFQSRRLDERLIRVKYRPLKIGYVGRADTPMEVTVSIKCFSQPLFLVGSFMKALSRGDPAGCEGFAAPGGLWLPDFSTTLVGEDLGRRPGENF